MSAPVLEIDDIHTYYNQSYILQGLSLRVAPGEIVGVLGRNGVGKTTLMRSIVGFTPPRQGQIKFCGQDITKAATEAIVQKGIALVPQGRRIFRSLSVAENLAIAAQSRRTGSVPEWSMERVFDTFPRLRERRNQCAGTLSGGEQQMLAVGRALIGNPILTLLDEPTEGLSPLLVRELQSVLRRLKDEGATLVLVEQRVNFALALTDRIYLMSKGQIALETTPDVLRTDSALRHRYLGV
jgi:branched-chain amino acid transport system ATP-binding protein